MKDALVSYNLNHPIYVHLDEKGKKILKKYYKHDDISIWEYPQKEGYYKFQLWQFVDIFGGYSCGAYAPYSCNVFLEAEYIAKEK